MLLGWEWEKGEGKEGREEGHMPLTSHLVILGRSEWSVGGLGGK